MSQINNNHQDQYDDLMLVEDDSPSDPHPRPNALRQPHGFHYYEEHGRFYRVLSSASYKYWLEQLKHCLAYGRDRDLVYHHLWPLRYKYPLPSTASGSLHRSSCQKKVMAPHTEEVQWSAGQEAYLQEQLYHIGQARSAGSILRAWVLIQQYRSARRNIGPLAVYPLPSLHTSLPVRTRQGAVGDEGGSDKDHHSDHALATGPNRASAPLHTSQDTETASSSSANDMEVDVISGYECGSEESRFCNRDGTRSKSLESLCGYALANEEEPYGREVVDGAEDDGWDGCEMDSMEE